MNTIPRRKANKLIQRFPERLAVAIDPTGKHTLVRRKKRSRKAHQIRAIV